ncbi:MAG: YeeE/YedE family protein [Haloarculaceae archaeon]
MCCRRRTILGTALIIVSVTATTGCPPNVNSVDYSARRWGVTVVYCALAVLLCKSFWEPGEYPRPTDAPQRPERRADVTGDRAVIGAELFPNGIASYAIGGAFIGAGSAFIYLTTGIIAGASTFLESTLSYVSGQARFNRGTYLDSRDWRLVFTAGIVLGAAVYALFVRGGAWSAPTDVQWWRLFGGGILVGVGTRVGKGCTSGHGVCGVGSMSSTSIVNVATFMAVAIGTAQLVMALGVQP